MERDFADVKPPHDYDFLEIAREWLVRAQGHAREPHEKSLAANLERIFDLGFTNGQAAEFARLHRIAETLERIAAIEPCPCPCCGEHDAVTMAKAALTEPTS